MALIEPGDEVLFPDPSFPIYPSFARGLGGEGGSVWSGRKETGFIKPDVDEIARKITPRTTMLIFNSPNKSDGNCFHSDAVLEKNSRRLP